MNIRPKLLYPSLIVAAISVTVLSLTGIAALTGHLPGANATQNQAAQKQTALNSQSGAGGETTLAGACSHCGTVESVRVIERKGEGSGVGAVAGGLAGAVLGNQIGAGNGRTVMTIAGGAGGAYLGNEIEKNSKRSTAYQIRVRMENGATRTFYQNTAPAVASGDRVRVSNGAITQVL